MRESEVIERLRRIATAPEARGLLDDVAVLDGFVITHDSIAEGVHFLPHRPAGERRLEAGHGEPVRPRRQGRDAGGRPAVADHRRRRRVGSEFLDGVEAACESYGLPLIGGDTIALPEGAPRVLGLTAIGRAGTRVPDRAGGRPGDALWLVGTVGDAAAGLAQLHADRECDRPAGRRLSPPGPAARRRAGRSRRTRTR